MEEQWKWVKACAPIFVQPRIDVQKNPLLAVFFDFQVHGSCEVILILAGESSYSSRHVCHENRIATIFYRSHNYRTYGRTCDVNYLEYQGVSLNQQDWSHLFTTDYSGQQTWAHGHRGHIPWWFTLMRHYRATVPLGEWEYLSEFQSRPLVFMNTCNHLMSEKDTNPSLEKTLWIHYPCFLGTKADALKFAKDKVPTKAHLWRNHSHQLLISSYDQFLVEKPFEDERRHGIKTCSEIKTPEILFNEQVPCTLK